MDCPLSEIGVAQSIEASKHAAKIDFQTVWISPLRRCLQTAYYIFRDHPNFLKIRFKVIPEMREKIRVAGDIPALKVLDLIEDEFQAKYQGRLEIDRVEE